MDHTTVAVDTDTELEADAPDAELLQPELLVEELLVEEISIDGMCGVY